MKNTMTVKKSVQLAFILTMSSSMLLAANNVFAGSGAYAGGAVGVSRVDGSDFDDEDHAIKGFAGVKFNDYIGIEFALHDFGKAEDGIFSSQLKGASFAVAGFLPLNERISLFAKLGMLHWENKVKADGFGSNTYDGEELFYGVGVDVNILKSFALRVEIERYKVELSNDDIGVSIERSYTVDVASVGGMFTF